MLGFLVDLLHHPWALPTLGLLLLGLLALGYRRHRRTRNPLAQTWEGGVSSPPPGATMEERDPPD